MSSKFGEFFSAVKSVQVPQPFAPEPTSRIKVFGIGGGGGNAVSRMIEMNLSGVEFCALNTDVQALSRCHAPQKLSLGETATRGLGAGGDPMAGLRSAEENRREIRRMLEGVDMAFITAGMGGGTGGTLGCDGPGPMNVSSLPACDFKGSPPFSCPPDHCKTPGVCCTPSDCPPVPSRCDFGTCDTHGGTRALNFKQPACWGGVCVYGRTITACPTDICLGCTVDATGAHCKSGDMTAPWCGNTQYCMSQPCGGSCAGGGYCDENGACNLWKPSCSGAGGGGGVAGQGGATGPGSAGAAPGGAAGSAGGP